MALLKALSAEQSAFFKRQGYLKYDDHPIIGDDLLHALRQRSEDIAERRLTHVPERYIQFEAPFRSAEQEAGGVQLVLPEGTSRLDGIRKMTQLAYYDEVFEAVCKAPAILDVVEDLLGTPDIKLYTDQLMMKPRYNGTVTGWHQDSVAWPSFFPQDHVSCWLALDDATSENGCMTMLPESFKWGPIDRQYVQRFLELSEHPSPVEVELKAGYCLFHHGLNFHRTGENRTPHRRRGLAMHFMRASTMYLPSEDEEARMLTECEQPPGVFRFMSVRGREYPRPRM
jgi:ectoine hydroxylase-related dioxygenase (phytanoyl-CoA dioxygenase family)